MLKRLLSIVLTVALPLGAMGGQPAWASGNKPKYAKTEIEKANATCADMLLRFNRSDIEPSTDNRCPRQ